MTGVNKHILIGHLGHDPQVRAGTNGDKVVSFSLATSESWKDKATGERREETAWHRIVIFNPNLAEVASKYLKKGSKAYLEGQVLMRNYTGKDGVERTIAETVLKNFRGSLVLLDKAEKAPDPDETSYGGKSKPPFDDEIPF